MRKNPVFDTQIFLFLAHFLLHDEVNDGCYDLLTEVVNKTNAYAEAQYRAIALTRAAADPANLKTDDQAQQSKMLQTIMIRESPVGLYTAKEITAIRQYLDIPEEKSK